MDYKKLFSENLKALMTEKGISQNRLSEHIDVDQTTISAWVRGEHEPCLTNICQIMAYFDCTFEDLIS